MASGQQPVDQFDLDTQPEDNLTILYSFRRCPYAMRARMALAVSGICYNTVEVALNNKPAELLKASPKATVPVLVLPDGVVLDQSLDIMHWALQQNDPAAWLADQDHDHLIDNNDLQFKYHLDRYKYPTRYADSLDNSQALEQAKIFLYTLETKLQHTTYLYANNISLADIAIMPFVRQFSRVDPEVLENFGYTKLIAWLQRLTTSALFSQIMKKD